MLYTAVPENIFRRFFLIENVVHSDSNTINSGTHFLKIPQQEIPDSKIFTKLGLKHVMDSATRDKFLENPSYMPSFSEKD